LKTQRLTKIKSFTKGVTLAISGQIRPAITRQQIDLENYSNPAKSRKGLYFRMNKSG